MPILLQWYDIRQTVLLYTFEGDWTWGQFRELDREVWDIISTSDRRIDILMDYTDVSRFPMGITDILHLAGEPTEPDQSGNIIIIDGSFLIKILYGVFKRLYPKMAAIYHLAATLTEAVEILEAQRQESIEPELTPFK